MPTEQIERLIKWWKEMEELAGCWDGEDTPNCEQGCKLRRVVCDVDKHCLCELIVRAGRAHGIGISK